MDKLTKSQEMVAGLCAWLDGAGKSSAGHAMLLADGQSEVAAAILRSALLIVEAKD